MDECELILKENEQRLSRLSAAYDPISGEGLKELLHEERVPLDIPDFAIAHQMVPKEMMRNTLVKGIVNSGSIKEYIASHKWKDKAPEHLDIERKLRHIRHRHDFCFWAYFCIRITAKEGGRIRFKLNYPQLQVLSECERLRKEGGPIDIAILKARQWGGSTFSIFYQTWLAFEWDEYHSFVVAAHVQSAAETILSMLRDAIRDYPAWDLGLPDDTHLELSRRGTTNNAYVLKDASHSKVRETVFYIGSAEKPETLRSSAIHGAHYSEVGIWPDTPEKRPESLVADISGGMTKKALDMQVMESTAKSSDDFFHELWTSAKRGDSSYRPIFIPWYHIPHDTLPIKDRGEFVRWLLTHKDDENRNGRWKDPGKHYWWLWEQGATLEGINWYRHKRLDFTTYAQMANEAPTNDVEAFQSAGLKVFDFYEVERFARGCREPKFKGDLFSDAMEGAGVLDNIQFKPSREGKLWVWEMPDDSPVADRYAVAVDIGGPYPTSDFSSVRVIDRLMMMPEFGTQGKPNIVAEMHYHTDHDKLAYDAMRLAAWYGNALLVVESNTVEMENKERETGGVNGSEYILDIVGDLYPNLYMRHTKEEEVREGTTGHWGFQTNAFTKPKIISHMKACLYGSRWDEPSELCCEEMSQYIEVRNKFTAPPKKHDDVLMATAILLWVCFNEMDLPHWIKSERKARPHQGLGVAEL